jgi:hypothetical protein
VAAGFLHRPVEFDRRTEHAIQMKFFETKLRRGLFLIAGMALIASAIPGAAAERPAVASPQPVVRQYLSALRTGDLDAAVKLTATIENVPSGQILDGLAKYSKSLREQEVETIVHEARATENCAVVIIEQIRRTQQVRPSLMPIMLIKQDDAWKVLPKLNAEQRKTALTDDQTASVKELGKWFYQKIGEIETRSRDDYGKQLPIEAGSLAGAWTRTASETMTIFAFKKSGDFDETIVTGGKLTSRLAGKWTLADKRLKLSYNESAAAGKVSDQRVIVIMRNLLGLQVKGEKKRIWRRISNETRRKLLEELEKGEK